MLACICHPTTEAQVADAVAEGAHSVAEIGEACGAGLGCGTCHERLENISERVRSLPVDCPIRRLVAA